MERILEEKRNSADQQSLRTLEKTILPQGRQRKSLQEQFIQENRRLSYADFHHEITENPTDIQSKPSQNQQKEHIFEKKNEEEIIKHMSNLPSYLESGENRQDKVLNFGVLNWGRLEKWQYSQKQMPNRSSKFPQVNHSRSSASSIDGSTSRATNGHSSPIHQRMPRSSLDSHPTTSPIEDHSHVVLSFGESEQKFRDFKPTQSNTLNGQGKFNKMDEHSWRNHPNMKLEQSKRKDLEPKIIPGSNTIRYELNSSINTKAQSGEFTKTSDKMQKPDSKYIDQAVAKRPKPVVLFPRDLPQKNDSGEVNQKRFTERCNIPSTTELYSDFPNTCQVSCELNRKHSLLKQQSSKDAQGLNPLSRSVPRSAKIGSSPSKARIIEERLATVILGNSTANAPSSGLDSKVRSSSPFSRLRISLGRKSRSSNSLEEESQSDIPQLRSASISSKSGCENLMASYSSNDKSSGTCRAKSSPLRRLLDPLLKPKVEPLEKDLIEKTRKSSTGILDSSMSQSRKVKLDTSRCRTVDVNDPAQDKKHGSSTIHALVQVAIKNGLPLFTFAVDNVSDVLVATVKVTSLGKEKNRRVYTFFTVREIRKKNGNWLNQGGKGKAHDYIPNAVAQVKVSEPQFPNLTGKNGFSVREFVLFSIETSALQPSDELAAIVVKIPETIDHNCITSGVQSNMCKDLPELGLKECFSGVKSYSYSGNTVQSQPSSGSEALINATVILPSGIHSLPSKGGPSSLIERWGSGGSCDCGGWDDGCKLRVLANRNQVTKKSSEPCSNTNQFELFSQDVVEENQPVFSLAALKDRIYSVEFNSSLSLLQAFAICIAILDSKNPREASESSNSFGEKTTGETTKLLQQDRMIAPDRLGNVSAE